MPESGAATPAVSAAVLAAQQRLLELRRRDGLDAHGRRPTPQPYGSRESLLAELLPVVPQRVVDDGGFDSDCDSDSDSKGDEAGDYVKIFPDIALGILRRKKAAAGRVWLLLRHHDAAGRGRIATPDAIRLLTHPDSRLRVCGRRQLGNLLAAGDGLFWERDTTRDGDGYLRLRSAVRVAATLGVGRLGGSPVAVPLGALTGTIGQARAHLYASFHSGRTQRGLLPGQRRPRGPISRATLSKLSGAATNSQRNYERRAAVDRRPAIAIGPPAAAADEHELAWRRGRALFRLRDARGRYGRPGAVYLAWQLPNEYTGPHATLPRGRMKRLNRALADLFHDGMTGNDERTELRVTSDELRITSDELRGSDDEQGRFGSRGQGLGSISRPVVNGCRRFYNSAKDAMRARHSHECYWKIRDTGYEIRKRGSGRAEYAVLCAA